MLREHHNTRSRLMRTIYAVCLAVALGLALVAATGLGRGATVATPSSIRDAERQGSAAAAPSMVRFHRSDAASPVMGHADTYRGHAFRGPLAG